MKYKVNGLLKQQYRGGNLPTLESKIVTATDIEGAKKKFEKDCPQYNPVGAEEQNESGTGTATTDVPPAAHRPENIRSSRKK